MSFNLKSALRAFKFATARQCVDFHAAFKFERGIRIPNKFIQIRVQ